MKPTLLDTDTLSYYLNNEPATVLYAENYMQQFRQLSISIITYYEVLNGLYYRDARRRLVTFEKFTAIHQVLPLTLDSVGTSAEIFAYLRRTGRPIGHTDTLIAGVALANGMQLATNNTEHFKRIEGLELVNWAK